MIVTASAAFYLAAIVAGDPAAGIPRAGSSTAVPVVRFTFENDQDRDFDRQPDDWTRRKGRAFPAYVHSEIDRTVGHNEGQSLRFDVNGGLATSYSPPIPVGDRHAYVFEAYVKTESLRHDVALVSVSLLNHRRQRVERHLSTPVSGTHADWVHLKIGPFVPGPDVRFAVIACHIAHDVKMDIRGRVWFDDLTLRRLPRLSLVSSFRRHFMQENTPVEIHANVSGLEAEAEYKLRMELCDGEQRVIDQIAFDVEPEQALAGDATAFEATNPPGDSRESAADPPVMWKLPPQSNGYYEVTAILECRGEEIVRKRTSFAVLALVEGPPRERGEFGWTIEQDLSTAPSGELAEIAAEGGINWLKYPLWGSLDGPSGGSRGEELVLLLESLSLRKIKPVGLLNQPPESMRRMFADDWRGITEIFTMPPRFWAPSLNPVLARFWSHVRYWQLGGDSDTSFVGLEPLAETLKTVKNELDRIGRDTHVGVHWKWQAQLPSTSGMSQSFLSLSNDQPLDARALESAIRQSDGFAWPRWALIKSLPRSGHSPVDRGADLVKRMVAARHAGADAVFAWNIYDPEHGLLHPDGSPTPLFLPWRATALALRGAVPLGSIDMPNNSRNYAFVRDGEVTLILWGDEEVRETLYLGEKPTVTDLWGRTRSVARPDADGRQTIEVGPLPQIVEHCSEPVARWRSTMRFENGRVKSEHGEHSENLLGINTFPQGVSGTISVRVPNEWDVRPGSWQIQAAPGEEIRLPLVLTLPQNASLGPQDLVIEMDIEADRRYKFRIDREYIVGLGDVLVEVVDRRLDDGRLEIEQIITNNTPEAEVLNFRCDLRIPGMRPRKQFVTRLKSGKDHKFYYLPDADALRGKRVSIRAKQEGGRRILNYEWEIGKDWE